MNKDFYDFIISKKHHKFHRRFDENLALEYKEKKLHTI